MNLRAKEDRLFATWRKKYDSFVVDGAPNPDALQESWITTVIILKDINAPDFDGTFDLRRQLATDPDPWWEKVAPWCAGISHLPKSVPWSELKGMPVRECLGRFAFLQLKKTPGAGSVRGKTLAKFAAADATEIRTQLEIYEPDLIVGAGSGVAPKVIKHAFGGTEWRRTDRGVRYGRVTMSDGKPAYAVDYMHPSVRVKKSIVCYGLLDAVEEIVSRHGLRTGR